MSLVSEAAERIPVSYAQRRLYLLHLLDPSGLAYVINELLHVRGNVNLQKLADTFTAVCRRHESLRSTFGSDGSGVHMHVHANLLPDVSIRHTCDLATAIKVVQETARVPFDLQSRAPIRLTLVSTTGHDHLVLVTGHHIAIDGESFSQLLREWRDEYEYGPMATDAEGERLDFGDFALWDNERSATTADAQYWRDTLKHIPSRMELPWTSDASLRGMSAVTCRFVLDEHTISQLRAFAIRERVTEFSVYLTAYALLQSQLSGQRDVVVGVPVSARTDQSLSGVIGMMVDTLPIRVRMVDDAPFLGLVRSIGVQLETSKRHRTLALEEILAEHLESGRVGEQAALDSIFSWDVSEVPETFGSSTVERLLLDTEVPKVSLSMAIRASDRGVMCTLESSESLVDKPTLKSWMMAYTRILQRGIDGSSDASVASVCAPSIEDGTAAIWEGTRAPIEFDDLRELWTSIRRRSGPYPAVIDGDHNISYDALDARADHIASELHSKDIAPDSRVAIEVPRGVDQYVAVLGVLKHGCAYVPVDPAYPRDRRQYLREDSGCAAVITLSKSGALAVQVLSTESVPAHPAPDAAYVIYTSGSTGTPKGVIVEHRSVVNLAVNQSPLLEGSVRVAQFSSLSFDVSVAEMWMTWTKGAALVVLPEDHRIGPALERSIMRHGIDTLIATPTALTSLTPENVPNLRLIVSTGEPCPPSLLERFSPFVRFVNAYGPTEATVWTNASDDDTAGSVTIGRPLPNVTARIGRPGTTLSLVGVSGELWVGGPGVAAGYLGRDELTRAAFIQWNGMRWYRTGDICLMRPGGHFVTRGRADEQVKVSGYRIELGAIERVLERHPAVTAAAVAAPLVGGRSMLVAWIVLTSHFYEYDLRQWLSERIPPHELPTRIVPIESMPTGPTGKLDKTRLPIPGSKAADTKAKQPTMDFIAEVWRAVLGIDEVSVAANFFDVGGTSLLALHVFEMVRERFPKTEMTDVFRHPTILSLAAAIDSIKYPNVESGITTESRKSNRRSAIRRMRRR